MKRRAVSAEAPARIAPPAPLWRRSWVQAAAILILVLIAFAPGFRGVYTWDDEDSLVNNPTVHSPTGLVPIWTDLNANQDYYPLIFTTYWVEYRLWGVDPLGYHLVNALLHAGGAIALFFVLQRLGLKAAWPIAALWAIHPLQVESVTWVVERKNVLSGVLFFSAILAYLRFAGIGGVVAQCWRWWLVALVCFIGALLSKPLTCTLPAVLLVLLYWKSDRLRWRDLWPALVFFIPAITIALVGIWVQRHHVGAVGPDFAFTPVERILIAGRAVAFYLWKTLIPFPLMQIHPRFIIDPLAVWQYLFPLAVLAAIALLWLLRRRIGRGPFAAAACYVTLLAPALGFISFYTMLFTFVADHFQYLALAAILALLVETGYVYLGQLRRAALMLALGVCVALSLFHASLYQSEPGLWEFNRGYNPHSFMVLDNLGTALLNESATKLDPLDPRRADYDRSAVAALKYAAGLAPQDSRAYIQLLAYAYRHFDPELFRFAYTGLRACPLDPNVRGPGHLIGETVRAAGGDLNFFLGQIYERRGDYPTAIASYRANLHDFPHHAKAMVGLANCLFRQHQVEDARTYYTQALEANPRETAALLGLANIAASEQHADEALRLFRQAQAIDPTIGPPGVSP